MIVQFRQGIVKYNEPVMVQVNFPNVNLIASVESPLIVNIASGTHNFLHAETQNITSAWTGLALNTHIWLYLDIDKRTAVRTFGTSFYEPVVGTNPPASPAVNQHWFDLTTSEMKVWTGTAWSHKIRIFLCMLQNGVTPISLSDLSPTSFAGTQVGQNVPVSAGYILFDINNTPIIGSDNTFITTEDKIRVASLTTSDVKVGSLVVTATVQQTVPAYSIVEFTDFGQVSPATAWTTSTQKQFGIVETSFLLGEVATIAIDGIITNSNWDWTSVGVNAYLYVNNTGQLITTPIIPEQQPVAIVTDVRSIMLIPKVVISRLPPALSTEALPGTVQLSVPAEDAQYPIAVGDNDPRITTAANKVDRAGDTMTGGLTVQGPVVANSTLTLSTDPITNLQAATKQYVDVAVSQVVSNLIWLPSIADPDLLDDSLAAPPITTTDEVYIIGSSPTGAWFGLAGHAVRWNGTGWTDILGRAVQIGDRFGVGMEHGGPAAGGLLGLDNALVEITNATPGNVQYSVTAPMQGQAVLANNPQSFHFGHQYTFNGTVWVELLGEIPLDSLVDVVITTPATGQALTFNGTTWVNATPDTTLTGLTDVTLTTPILGQALTFNGVEWVNATPNAALAGLSDDVTLTSPVSGQALTFNGTKWVNATPNTALAGLTDVTLTAPVAGHALTFNGTKWVNTAPSSITLTGDITGTGTSSIATTLATVNTNIGSFGDSLNIAQFTVNDKGLITAAAQVALGISVAVSGGTTGLTTSGGPITSTGTITLSGTLAYTNGGTGLTSIGAGLQALRTNITATGIEWGTVGTITSVDVDGSTTGLTFTGGPITTAGTLTLGGTLGIANGGTGQTTANNAINALLPTQSGNAGKQLTTDGTNTSWTNPTGRVSAVPYSASVSLNWTNLDVIRITLTGNITITNQLAGFDGQRVILELIQDGVGNRTVSFTSETIFGTDIVYTASTLPNKTDVIGLYYHQASNKFRIIAVARGY